MSHPKTIKVKPWGADQGDHVVINESDFDPSVHEKFEDADEKVEKSKRGRKSGSVD